MSSKSDKHLMHIEKVALEEWELIDKLPHGSGIDDDWYMEVLRNGNIECRNSYHMMNDGGYCGWQDFKIVIFQHKGDWDFRLHLTGFRHRCNAAYGMKDYLSETIGEALSDILPPAADGYPIGTCLIFVD